MKHVCRGATVAWCNLRVGLAAVGVSEAATIKFGIGHSADPFVRGRQQRRFRN